jgi:hypothetical protein
VHELIDSLQALDASIDASTGMEQFFESVHTAGMHEVIFIASPQGYRQPAVQKVIHDWIDEIAYCITASDVGELTVMRKRSRGLAHLQTFSLPLNELWKNPPVRKEAPAQRTEAEKLPSEYPILLPQPNKIRAQLMAGDGQVFIISKENTVLKRWSHDKDWQNKGWYFVRDKLPVGACSYAIGISSTGEYLLLVHVISSREVHLYNLTTKATAVTHLDSYVSRKANPEFIFWDDGFVVRDRHTVSKFYLERSSDRHDAPAARITQIDLSSNALKEAGASSGLQPMTYSGHNSVLRNIKRISISYSGTLLVNQHELVLQHNSILVFKSGVDDGWIPARFSGANCMEFPDGSTVSISRDGMLILRSANEPKGAIYIPCVLDVPLGVATNDYYAGADFFNPHQWQGTLSMTLAAFYDQFIEDFISQVKKHATAAKAG